MNYFKFFLLVFFFGLISCRTNRPTILIDESILTEEMILDRAIKDEEHILTLVFTKSMLGSTVFIESESLDFKTIQTYCNQKLEFTEQNPTVFKVNNRTDIRLVIDGEHIQLEQGKSQNFKFLIVEKNNKRLKLLYTNIALAQELFRYQFDDNVSLEFPEYGEENESEFIQYTSAPIADGMLVLLKTNLGSYLLPNIDRNFDKFCQGTKQGILNKTKGKAIEESKLEIDNVKVFKLIVSMEIENEVKIMESYNFMIGDFTYAIQFLSPEKESDEFRSTKKKILDSIILL